MSTLRQPVPGVTIEVDELLRIRARVSAIAAAIKRRASDRSGAREIRLRGRGMEYEESRAYVSGDDVRTIDWRVMARTGEAHTKVFAEEKARRYLLAVDQSASMFFGTRVSYKSRAAAVAAAHLGWLASRADDRVGGLIVAPNAHYEVRPGKARTGLLGVFHHLAEISHLPQPGCQRGRLNFLLQELLRVAKPGSIITLISDFIDFDDDSAEALYLLTRHNQVDACWIYDEIETEPWRPGLYPTRFGDSELDLDLANPGTRQWLRHRQRAHRDRVGALAARFNLPLYPICCNREVTPQIATALGT